MGLDDGKKNGFSMKKEIVSEASDRTNWKRLILAASEGT